MIIGHWSLIIWRPRRFSGVTIGLPLRIVRFFGREPEALQRLPEALAALQTAQNRLRGDLGVLRAEIVRQHAGRDELAAREFGIGLTGRFERRLKRVGPHRA